MQKMIQKRARAFGFFGLAISSLVLGISLAGSWLLNDQSIIFTLAIATLSLQLILNDLFWRTQRRIAERGEQLLYCQLNSKALHVLRSPLLTVQSLISNGMLVLIWVTLISGAIWLAMRNGVQRGYLTITWICGCVLSVSWFGWILFGRRCLSDDEILISENACLASGRLDRWDLPGWHLLTADFRANPAADGGVLLLRIWREGPYQQLIERYLPLPREYMSQAKEACASLQANIKKPSEGIRIRRISAKKEKTAKKREQYFLEPVHNPARVSQWGDIILLIYAVILGIFSQWIVGRPQYVSPRTGYSFEEWYLPYIAGALGFLAVLDILLNWRRNRSFRASLSDKALLQFRLPSLWLECHLPEALYAARRELFNDGLLLVIGVAFTALTFNIRRPDIFRYFLEHEITLLLVILLLVFLVFVVYRDWALRRRLGLVQLSQNGVWLYDRQHRWGGDQGRLLSCTLEAAPTRSFESARLMLRIAQKDEGERLLQVPLDKPTAARVQELLDNGELRIEN